jgi:hypothetical protein
MGLTHSLTEINTGAYLGVEGREANKADKLTVICETIV